MDVLDGQQLMSPTSFLPSSKTVPSSDEQPHPSRSIPLQKPVSSASQLPNPQSKLRSAYRHLASSAYVEEYQEVVDSLRQAHTRDRNLWRTEREELHERILELESELRLLRTRQDSGAKASADQLNSTNLGSLLAQPLPRKQSTESTGREFWRGLGGMSDAHPTRTFSETSSTSAFSNVRLPSISEDLDYPRKESAGFNGEIRPLSPLRRSQRLPSIPGDRLDAKFDGISFKPSGLPPSVVKSVLPSIDGSPSPMHSPSPLTSLSTPPKPTAEPRPKLLNLPSSFLTADERRLEDAGHTPLARVIAETSSNTSSATTPISKVFETERPLEPFPTQAIVRPPHERRDSYFPDINEATDEDPILKEPLGLTNDKNGEEDTGFLSTLDSKLLQAQRSTSFDLESQASGDEASTLEKVASPSEALSHNGTTHTRNDYDETEPKLRIKRSMNFGAPFGTA